MLKILSSLIQLTKMPGYALGFFFIMNMCVSAESPPRIQPVKAGMSYAFAVETEKGLFLIDAGSPGKEKSILQQLKRFSQKKLELIIITHAHFDHYGSAAALRKETGARIAISKTDAIDMEEGRTRLDSVRSWGRVGKFLLPLAEAVTRPKPTKPNILLQDKDSLSSYGLPAYIRYTPGHTKGSISVILSDTIAFVGDLIVSQPKTKVQCYFANNWEEIKESLRLMEKIDPSIIYSGHSEKSVDSKKIKSLLKN